MSVREMIAAVDEEIERLQLARRLLAGEGEVAHRIPVAKSTRKKPAAKPVRARRALSPEARERIGAAQRKRWAASKKAAKKAAKQL